MDRGANHRFWPTLCFFILTAAGAVWNCGIVRGQTQVLYPADGAVILGENYPPNPPYTHIYTWLDFIPGPNAVKHTCYFSDNYADVANRIEDANLGEPPVPPFPNRYYVGLPIDDLSYQDSLVRGTTYYWTVDETDAEDQTFPGDIWEFSIYGYYAFEPDPPNEAVDVETDVFLSWQPGVQACCCDIYIGTSWDDVNNAVYDSINPPPEFLDTLWEPNILVTGLDFNTKYYWRVDEIAGRCAWPFCGGTYYKGDVWCFTTEEQRIFVDVDATGANDGASWENAYNFLQDALADANSAEKPVEIRVAGGIYTPDSNSADPNRSGDRTATFKLINGVILKGGYAGFGEPDPNARDIELYETILSGDLAGNDIDVNDALGLYDDPCRAENSLHVLIADAVDSTAVLDGFTIAYGNANAYSNYNGGGLLVESSDPKLVSCTFTRNSSLLGGGICANSGSPIIVDCSFRENFSLHGGGMLGGGSSTISENCLFVKNYAQNTGGALNCYEGKWINCTYIQNSSGFEGGAIDSDCANFTLENCLFIENTSDDRGGAISNYESEAKITNCTFVDNYATWGLALYEGDCESVISNCIFWGDQPNQIIQDQSESVIMFCNVKGGWPYVDNFDDHGLFSELGNIDADPCFVDAGGGDFRLSSDSPCIDAGDNSAPNLPDTDMDGHPRIIDGDCNDTEVVDMGAYEFNYAYMGDFDYNCEVDFADFSIIALAWMAEPGDHNWDPVCNIAVPADSLIDWRDVAILCDNWLEDNNPKHYCIVEGDVEYCIRTDKSVYHLGETVEIFYRITNLGSVPVSLGWVPIPPFCYRFVIVDNNGEHVWLWSWVMPTSPPVEFILDAYESKEHEIGWDMTNDNGTYGTNDDFPAGPGVYKITGELFTGSEEDRVKVSVSVNVRE